MDHISKYYKDEGIKTFCCIIVGDKIELKTDVETWIMNNSDFNDFLLVSSVI